ncbi:hypothetical protein D5086_016833 [Populus alba]|uniref:Uncharacterized protein n=1 Tax=Populus alba TaxID=43335 RepID=A0ACC4BWV7_POPAL
MSKLWKTFKFQELETTVKHKNSAFDHFGLWQFNRRIILDMLWRNGTLLVVQAIDNLRMVFLETENDDKNHG